nr:hypothetical protein [Pyrinomonadaceae bacterium]
MLEMTLAAQVAARDPGEAVRLIEEGLSKGVTSGMLNVLSQLQRQDPAAAAKVTGEIIKRLRPEEFGIDHEMTNVAINLWQMNRPPTLVPTSAPTSDGVPTQTADTSSRPGATSSAAFEQARRELAEKLAAAVTGMPAHRTGNAQHLFTTLKGMMPELEKYAPARAPAVRRRMSEFEKTLPPYIARVAGSTGVDAERLRRCGARSGGQGSVGNARAVLLAGRVEGGGRE